MRPEATLLLLGYNREHTIDAAIASALAQQGEPIEILLSDDASTDATHKRMLEWAARYDGPHTVRVRRNAENLGVALHSEAAVHDAAGRLVVFMDSDDLSLPTRVAETLRAWRDSGRRLDLIASHVIDMEEDGRDVGLKRVDRLQDWPDVRAWTLQRPYVIGAAQAVTKRLYERFGPLRSPLLQPDQVNVLRALCSGGAMTIEAPLVRYRRGGMSAAPASPASFRERLAHRTRRHLAVIDQWVADAREAGHGATVEGAIEWNRRRELFVQALLEAGTLAQQLRVVLTAGDVDAHWRWRRLADVRVTRAALLARRVRDAFSPRGEANAQVPRRPSLRGFSEFASTLPAE